LNAQPTELVALGRITVDDPDATIGRKLAVVEERYPKMLRTDLDDLLQAVHAPARDCDRRGLRKLFG
jgi:hypothetical protein